MHTPHLDIRNTMSHRVKILSHRKPRSIIAYTCQCSLKRLPRLHPVSPNECKEEDPALTVGYSIHKIIGLAGEMVMDSKGAFRALHLGERTDVFAGMAPEMLIHR